MGTGPLIKQAALVISDREMREIRLARYYTKNLNHGTSGHLAYSVIAKLSEALEELGVILTTEES